MGAKPTVRFGTIHDLEAIIELEKRGFPADHFSRRQFRHLLTKAQATVLVIESGGEVGGVAIMLWRRNITTGRLYTIVIDPRLQGQGLGKILLEACQKETSRRRLKGVSLEVRADNKSAIRFYERHGYRINGSLPGYYSDGSSGLRMVKSLI